MQEQEARKPTYSDRQRWQSWQQEMDQLKNIKYQIYVLSTKDNTAEQEVLAWKHG